MLQLKPKQEFYTADTDGKEHGLVVACVKDYPLGPCVTLLRRMPDGKMGMGLQLPVADLQAELEDDLCGRFWDTPTAEQKKLVGKIPAEMNAYFN